MVFRIGIMRFSFRNLVLLQLLVIGFSAQAQWSSETNAHGISIQIGSCRMMLGAERSGVLRLGVSYSEKEQKLESTFLAKSKADEKADWTVVRDGKLIGVKTAAGELLADPRNGSWTFRDAKHKVLIPLSAMPVLSETNGKSSLKVALEWNPKTPEYVYGCGNGVRSLWQTNIVSRVGNGIAVIPYFWTPQGYGILAIGSDDNQPATWSGVSNQQTSTWNFVGSAADLYLMPAPDLETAVKSYAETTGHAPVPPRWTFGYLQSRWGWTNREYIEETLQEFRTRKIPVDAFIYDYEWYTSKPDNKLVRDGEDAYRDFDWNTNLFPEPASQISNYRNHGIRFVGIRKPRIGNATSLSLLRGKGWSLNEAMTQTYSGRDMDFANPDLRNWYVDRLKPLYRQDIAGWWNDEGESSYTTYFYWNLAESQANALCRTNQRLWTINRAFSPGMQRLGAAAWTGDIRSKWSVLNDTPTSLLNWSLAGMPYGACDIGGFKPNPTPEMLARWMEAGAFFPVMRAHSALRSIPRFPWLYGPEALNAIHKAINLRYQMIPYFYSWAHQTYETGLPLMRPLCMEYPDDPTVLNLSSEWLVGDSLLVAPVLQPGDERSVYLPAGKWYVFNKNSVFEGKRSFSVAAGLNEIPLYVRAGTVLPLGPVVQHTGELPGGPLEVQIYPGADASFTLVEDDGETTDYQKGIVRRTIFNWNDAKKELTWDVKGPYAGKDIFTNLQAVLFDRNGILRADRVIDRGGSLSFEPESSSQTATTSNQLMAQREKLP